MIWRGWCFLSGLGPGALGGLAAAALVLGPGDEVGPLWARVGALLGGALLLGGAWALDRRPQDEPDRGARFARAASVGLVAWPALSAAFLGLPPGAAVSFALVLALLGLAFVWAARRRGPAGGIGGQLGTVAAALAGGVALFVGLGAALAAIGTEGVVRTDDNRRAVMDHDAGIATVALPACAPSAARVEVLHDAGAHPRLSGDAQFLFFDAPGPEGRRQIHRRAAATGEIVCLTCEEDGNNRRPAPSVSGTVVLFDTDRHATWRHPRNTELHLVNAAAAQRGVRSRRITYAPGPDERAIFGPAPNTLAWSSGEGGRYRVVSGGLVSGHGSLQVGAVGLLREGGADWIAPLAWAPDARALAFARGNPLGPARVDAFDPGTEAPIAFEAGAVGAGSLSFNADGGWYAQATARRARPAGLLPDALGFALAPAFASQLADGAALFHGTEVVWGPTGEAAQPVALGETANWGWPTGLGLEPDGKAFVLGQRRAGPGGNGAGAEERLVRVELDCP